MLGMQTKSIGSVLNETDRIIEGMLAPAPQYRNANDLSLIGVDNVKELLGWVGQTQKSFEPMSIPEGVKYINDGVLGFLRDSGPSQMVKKTYLSLMSSRVLGQVTLASGMGDVAVRLQEAIQDIKGAMQASDEQVNKIVKQVLPWMKKNPKQAAALDRVIYSRDFGATIFQVDPTKKDDSSYREKNGDPKEDNDGNDLVQIYKAQRKDWNSLGK